MSDYHLPVLVPASYVPPPIMRRGCPEVNVRILTEGARIVEQGESRAAGLADTDVRDALDADNKRKIEEIETVCLKRMEEAQKAHQAELDRRAAAAAAEKAAHDRSVEDLRSKFELAQSDIRIFSGRAATAESRIADAQKAAREETERKNKATIDDLSRRLTEEMETSKEEHRLREEAAKLAASAKQASTQAEADAKVQIAAAKEAHARDLAAAKQEAAAALAEAVKSAATKTLEAERGKAAAIASAEAKVRREMADEADRDKEKYQEHLRELTGRKAGSSTKGAEFEDDMERLISKAFGVKSDFKVIVSPKEHLKETGDEIVEMDGIRTMYEFKNYATIADKHEVAKAHRDMDLHRECHALVFVSKNAEIAGHQKPGHFDIGVLADGRPSIWVGKFDDVPDKVVYLQMIHLIVIELLKLAKKAAESGEGGLLESCREKVTAMRRSFQEINEEMSDHGTAMRNYKSRQKKAWDELETSWVGFVGKFKHRLTRALKENDDEEEESCGKPLVESKVCAAGPPMAGATPAMFVSAPVDTLTVTVTASAPATAGSVSKEKIVDKRNRLQGLWRLHGLEGKPPTKFDELENGLKGKGIPY